jgi:UDP-N-acetyl-D-glucosamine dehydrogenase
MTFFYESVDKRNLVIGVIGLGYVGLPLAVEFASNNFKVIGFDVIQSKVDAINAGKNYIKDVDGKVLARIVEEKYLVATNDFSRLSECDSISICVPTPLSKMQEPDISFIIAATREIAKYLKIGALVVLESTTYPGTTDEILLPALSQSGRKVGSDFYLAFSPERVDPGNLTHHTKNTPKVIGGVTEECIKRATYLYGSIIEKIVPVSSTAAAEMVKLVENTFRAINIASVNEIALICHRLGLNVWEIIDAAATKPFGFNAFYPGPGLGGHCIPIDPLYLSWKMKFLNFRTRFIDLANDINRGMPHWVVNRTEAMLNKRLIELKGGKVFVLGVAYKRDIDDFRESPALEVIHNFKKLGADVRYHDPYISKVTVAEGDDDEFTLESVELSYENIEWADIVICTTDHSIFDWKYITEHASQIFDARNATKGIESDKIERL